MKKPWKILVPAAVLVLILAVLLWPLSFPDLEAYHALPVSHTYRWLDSTGDCAVLENTTEDYLLEDLDTLNQVNQALQAQSYHRCLHTLFPFLSPSSASLGSHSLLFALPEEDGVVPLTLTDGRHLYVGSRVYCLGYWGNHAAQATTQEILSILSRAPEAGA